MIKSLKNKIHIIYFNILYNLIYFIKRLKLFKYKCQYINEQKIKNKNVQKRKLCNLSRFIFYFFYFVFYSIGSTCNINNMRVMQ